MNKTLPNQPLDQDEAMLPDYDFSGGVCGKHAVAYQRQVK